MAYLESSNIKVFPCGGRNSECDPLARFTTEYNLISLINRLVDKTSFIVTNINDNIIISDSNNNYKLFQFNIGGYLFTIPNGFNAIYASLEQNTNNYNYITAKINTQSYNDYIQLMPLEGVNENTSYYASILDKQRQGVDNKLYDFMGLQVNYSESPVENSSTQLTLFERKGNNWYCYQDSKIKFETNSTGRKSVRIDDGVI